MDETSNDPQGPRPWSEFSFSLWMVFGLVVGVVIGMLIDSVIAGIGIGLALGIAMNLAFGRRVPDR